MFHIAVNGIAYMIGTKGLSESVVIEVIMDFFFSER